MSDNLWMFPMEVWAREEIRPSKCERWGEPIQRWCESSWHYHPPSSFSLGTLKQPASHLCWDPVPNWRSPLSPITLTLGWLITTRGLTIVHYHHHVPLNTPLMTPMITLQTRISVTSLSQPGDRDCVGTNVSLISDEDCELPLLAWLSPWRVSPVIIVQSMTSLVFQCPPRPPLCPALPWSPLRPPTQAPPPPLRGPCHSSEQVYRLSMFSAHIRKFKYIKSSH